MRVGLALGGLGVLLGAGWLGFQIAPAQFPKVAGPPTACEGIELPAGLPAPVERYFRMVLGNAVPPMNSAVLSGRGRLRLSGVTLPVRMRFIHATGQAYRHYIEGTWFGYPFLRVNEHYVDGHARLQLPVGVVANEPKVDQGANLALWGEEAFWMPSVLITDPRVRWVPVDATTARLLVPFGETEDQFTVSFEPESGLLRRLEALRYRSAADADKIPWFIEPLGWETFEGMLLPTPVALTWQDEGSPWLVINIDNVAYGADVSASVRASGP